MRKRSTPTRTDPAQRAAIAAAREITQNNWDLRDSTGEYFGIGTIDRTVDSLALFLLPAIRRALRKPAKRTRKKGDQSLRAEAERLRKENAAWKRFIRSISDYTDSSVFLPPTTVEQGLRRNKELYQSFLNQYEKKLHKRTKR